MAEFPERALGMDIWVRLFRRVGFVSDGAPPPATPLTVYRGATWGRRRDMAWTTDRVQAKWFAARCSLTSGRNGRPAFSSQRS